MRPGRRRIIVNPMLAVGGSPFSTDKVGQFGDVTHVNPLHRMDWSTCANHSTSDPSLDPIHPM